MALLQPAAWASPAPRSRGGLPTDGVDLSPVLFGTGPGLRRSFVYYRDTTAYALRKGR
jgi:hypothetical protein